LANKINKIGLYSLEPITLQANIARDEALLLKVKYATLPGVTVAAKPIRRYDNTITLAHFLGYVGKITQDELDKNTTYSITDDFGKNGLEQVYEKYLKGKNGQDQMEVNSKGQVQRILSTSQPQSGNNLILTLNLDLQKKITEILSNMTDKSTKRGVVVAMNPQTGGILAMVSLPSYDNNIFSQADFSEQYQKLLDDPEKPLINRAVSGLYPSGSTIKPFIASAGLQEGVISENTTINDTGPITVGEWSFPDWKVHGLTDVRKAIAQSCDIFFYAVGGGWDKIKGLGLKKIDEYLNKFGFGAKTGIDLPSEEKGLVPDAEWKKKVKKESWYVGDTYHLSIGQGDFLTTPLQLVNATSAIANGGKLLKPHFVDKITAPDGSLVQQINTEVIRDNFISPDVINIVREGMRQTVTDGSGRLLQDLTDKNGNAVAATGKTGTAQFGNEDLTHSWFISFAPYDNPSIAIAVLVEGGGEGNESALPVAKEILQYWFNK
jgi:penicillin-binding protein 2